MKRKIIALLISCAIALVFIRAKLYGWGYGFLLLGPSQIKKALLISFEDIAFVTATGMVFILLAHFLGKKWAPAVLSCWLGWVFVLLSWAFINSEAVKILNVPINYQLLYYADLFESSYILDSMAWGSSSWLLIEFLCVNLLVFGLGWLLYACSTRVMHYKKVVYAGLLTVGVCLAGYFFLAHRYVESIKSKTYDQYGRIQNPATAFFASFYRFYNGEHKLLAALESLGNKELLEEKRSRPTVKNYQVPSHPLVKNVIFYVLESVSAAYVAGYEDQYGAMPNLQRYLPQSLVFKDVYAHTPNSANALFALLSASYPLISFKNTIMEHTDVAWPTISSELQARQYNTAFFNASDNTYASTGKYLSYRGFDMIRDYRQMSCQQASFIAEAEGAEGGIVETCMIDAFTHWLGGLNQQEPFFSVLWTIQTHWPYFVNGEEKDWGVKHATFNRYLNALQESDAALGKLLDHLEERGLAASTLVVVVGDHGEAFGGHGQFGHGSNIYEENIRVPLIFINPLLFGGEERQVIGGHVDVAATVFDVLNIPAPGQWQGMSLLNPDRTNQTYFFSTWSEYLFGYRTPEQKIIYNAYQERFKVYDLQQDPQEKVDLSGQFTDQEQHHLKVLSDWISLQRLIMEQALQQTPKVVEKSSM